MEMMEEDKNIQSYFDEIVGQKIVKFTVEEGVDQIFTLETDKAILKFGANDLGVWLIELKEKRDDVQLEKIEKKE